MPLPSDLDILRCCVSRTVPCRYTVWNGASPMNAKPAMIMRATQKNRISGAVTSTSVGIERLQVRRCPRSASRAWRSARATTRTRCRARPRPARTGAAALRAVARGPRAARSRAAARTSSQYHTGMRWPHQSCREMFQSRMFSSQCTYTPSQRSGRMRIAPVAHGLERRLGERLPSSRTTGRTGAARRPCRSGSSAARCAGAARSSPVAQSARACSTIALARVEAVEARERGGHAALGVRAPRASMPVASMTTGIGSPWRRADLEVVRHRARA